MTHPTITAVIPCYNGAAFLRETLESVLTQTFAVEEIIVVDDGSTDDSSRIAASYGDRVRVIRQPNLGESIARNRGIREAKGHWVAFLDADDRWEPTKLERQVKMITPEVIAVHTGVYTFGSEEGVFDEREVPPEILYSLEYVAAFSPLHPSSLIVRHSHCPLFPTHTRYGEDLIFQLDLVRKGRIAKVPEALCGYRKHERSQSKTAKLVHLRWNETIETWLSENESRLSATTVKKIRADAVDRLIAGAQSARWHRRWADYRALRDHLQENYASYESVQAFLQQPTYPPVVYWLKDAAKRLLAANR